MDAGQLFDRADEILGMSGALEDPRVDKLKNTLEYMQLVFYAARQLTPRDREVMPWLRPWAEGFRALYDNFEEEVKRDPMILYSPANKASLAFHKSRAFIRYFMAGNRTSKTQSGYAEHYYCATGVSRDFINSFGPPPHASGLIAGLPFTDYMPQVFGAKMLTGEEGNPLAPMFPEGGKWFNYWDSKEHTLYIACPECAEKGQGGTCCHHKSTIRVFSSEKGYEAIQGAVFKLMHFDEDLLDEKPFAEALVRLTTSKGRMILTGTPLHGPMAWEQRLIYQPFLTTPPEENRYDVNDPDSPPRIEVFRIDMRSAEIAGEIEIRNLEAAIDEIEARARIGGEPIPIATNPVFDRRVLRALEEVNCAAPIKRGDVKCVSIDDKTKVEKAIPFEEVMPNTPVQFIDDSTGPIKIWEMPQPGAIYLSVADTAKGVSVRDPTGKRKGDYSCNTIFKVTRKGVGLALEEVAQYHAHVNLLTYAEPVFLLAVMYNSALVVIETTGGYGEAVALKLKNEFGYWNLYRAPKTPDMVKAGLEPRVGVDTGPTTKPFMVTCAARMVNEGFVLPKAREDYGELAAFNKVDTGSNGQALRQPEYKGVGGSPDDRAMTYVIGCAICITSPQLLELVAFDAAGASGAKEATKDMESLYAQMAEEKSAQEGLV